MADALALAGFTETDVLGDADLVILNTCHIREKAAEKVYSELGRIRLVREARRLAGRDCVIAVAGCVAQAEGEELARRAPAVDIVVGPQSYHRLPYLLERQAKSRATVVETEFPAAEKFEVAARAEATRRAVGVSHHSGRLQQVLHLLRRALYKRSRVFPSCRADPR